MRHQLSRAKRLGLSAAALAGIGFATTGVGAVDARLGPADKTLWVDESAANQIGVFSVNGTSLTQLPSAQLPAGAAAAGIVVI